MQYCCLLEAAFIHSPCLSGEGGLPALHCKALQAGEGLYLLPVVSCLLVVALALAFLQTRQKLFVIFGPLHPVDQN
jgi:hypothetical protein